jgi:hypothetical protein
MKLVSRVPDQHLHPYADLTSVLSMVLDHTYTGAASWGPLGAGVSRAITWAGAGGSGSTVGGGGSTLARLPTTPHSPRHRCEKAHLSAATSETSRLLASSGKYFTTSAASSASSCVLLHRIFFF